MATISEYYVSFETAKLLKKKGFNELCAWQYYTYWEGEKLKSYKNPILLSKMLNNSNVIDKDNVTAPTLQMAMKWLREVHNLFIEIIVGETEGKTWYDYDIIPINGKVIYWKELDVSPPVIECNTPEEAIEIGLKYCLENLI